MKSIFKLYLLALIFTLSTFLTVENADCQSSSPVYAYQFDRDTFTNSNSDTLLIPTNLISKWSYCWSIDLDRISGAGNSIFIIEESASTSGDLDWIEITRDTFNTDGNYRFVGDPIYGRRQRLIAKGTGTHSTDYHILFVGKKE